MKWYIKYLAIILISMTTFNANAQLKYTDYFQAALEKANISFSEPLENTYKNVRIYDNDLQPYHFAIRSKKEKVEIRYAIELIEADAPLNPPQVRCFARGTSVASNDEEAAITIHRFNEKELKEFFNADWGMIMYFKPKLQFSDKKHCKMLSLYSENRAVIYVYFLFNEPSEELDNQLYSIRFNEETH